MVLDGVTVPAVHVDFPVWRQRLPDVRALLLSKGFEQISLSSMVEEIVK
jgi:hypothetical protein